MDNKISVGGIILSSINFAMQQNYVPVIRKLVIGNETQEILEDMDLLVSFEPQFAKDYSYHISEIPVDKAVEISPVNIRLDTDYLFSLTEKLIGSITIKVIKGQAVLYEYVNEIELLAYDQWSGILVMPEIIAAYVTPNHPRISQIISNASKYLGTWTNSPSFTGYQTGNVNNVRYQMAAIYEAIKDEEIIYNNPPASYEVMGQRIRLPHAVLEQKQGTCIDLTILYVACLEAVGLFPLICFVKGHAFAGCWLEEDTFADCVVDDVSSIEKRIAEGAQQITLVECVNFVAGEDISFDRAEKHGKDYLIRPENFMCVVDIQRSRGSGIRPIPLKIEQAYIKDLGDGFAEASDIDELDGGLKHQAPSMIDDSLINKVVNEIKPMTKQQIWERKLLDFGLRNPLLNFRGGKNSFRIMTANLGELEDRLSDGKDFRIMEAPTEWTMSLRDAKMFEIDTDKDLFESIATEEFKSYRIRTFLHEKDLEVTLKSVYRSAKMSMEENGSNTLYLALGFLRWFETDISEKARYAPIVLIPVDIVRNVKNKGYIIRSRQEDAQVNVTLIEYLKQDHGVNISGLDPLPEDDHGIDLPLVFNTVRHAVMGKKHWNVEEMAFVGLFSFGQFVMWNDIHNRSAELEKNKVVSSLEKGAMVWQPEEDLMDVDSLDAKLNIADMAIPVSADSSQMAAIASAAKGQSFVLHGPPGTGKSQTITNMIANALYQGKTVLFVAEKMAALNVVQHRLANIGLDPFCLELHSNKTNKSSVLAELDKTLNVGRIKKPEEYEAVAAKVHELRNKLNYIVLGIHTKRLCGKSLYEIVEICERYAVHRGKIDIPLRMLSGVNKDTIEQWNLLVRQYAVTLKDMGETDVDNLKGYEGTEYSLEIRDNFSRDVSSLLDKNADAVSSVNALCSWLGYSDSKDMKTIGNILHVVDAAMYPAVTLSKLINSPNYDYIVNNIMNMVNAGNQYNQAKNQMLASFSSGIFGINVDEARLKWKQSEDAFFLVKNSAQKKLLNEIRCFANNPDMVNEDTILGIYNNLSMLRERKNALVSAPAELTSYLSGVYMGEATDWNMVVAALKKSQIVREASRTMSIKDVNAYMRALDMAASNDELVKYKDIVINYNNELLNFKKKYSIDMSTCENSDNWLQNVNDMITRFSKSIVMLREKVAFNRADKILRQNGLDLVGDAYKKGKVNADDVYDAFLENVNYALMVGIISSDERLREFRGKQYDDMINQYEEAIDKYQQLTIQELVAKLSANVPISGTVNAATSEMGILKKAIKNNGRMMTLRRLFDQIPNLLRKICPCMLMSPISVAQYIDPSFPKFDLVIFDEASQLPTSEAVGTIARGENVVIVGDPKQLPPTNFFSANRIDEENGEKEDLESLLDDCLAISMPQESLTWHYRSKHESLIAYSNLKYYDNKLYTFPSPRDLISQVKMVHVEGYYDKGKTKQNVAEAKAIINEIVRRLKDEELRKESIGVVTFSSVQQNLIDDMLMEEFAKHPELDEIDKASSEPIFIKNLENVQGDERDVILFSIGYGPDENGKVSMNFGPLNRDGGWRRLNVAISRARRLMVVYSVLRPEQINMSRTRSLGVEGLKGFLEFAERGKSALVQKASSGKSRNDYLVHEVAEAINNMGYEAKCDIGCSEYKMDIGIVDKQDKDTYLLGILFDGENCKAASTARDRFVLQPGVLQGLGWRIIRLWTLDWLDNKERVINDLKKSIEEAEARRDESYADIARKEEEDKKQAMKEAINNMERIDCEALKNSNCSCEYLTCRLKPVGTLEDFCSPVQDELVRQVIYQFMELEAPISRDLLRKKTLEAFGITRVGSRVALIFKNIMDTVPHKVTSNAGIDFYWRPDQNPSEYNMYRVEDFDGNKRAMMDVSPEEILCAIKEVLVETISLEREELARETGKKFGYSRLTTASSAAINGAIDGALKAGHLKCIEENIILLVD